LKTITLTEKQYNSILKSIKDCQSSFYEDPAFWISLAIGIIGIWFSYIAFKEAREAKKAAKAAGNQVKKQTIIVDLTEIILRLDKISTELNYSDTRNFYSEINRKIRRCVSSLSTNSVYSDKVTQIISSLELIRTNLDGTRQTSDAAELGLNIYYAVEGEFSNLSGKLADFCGLLEQENIEK
jgi:hypothetical protein